MYAKLKEDMAAAGFATSEGENLNLEDLQPARDYFHRIGLTIGDDFHKYEEAKAALDKMHADALAAVDPEALAAQQAAEAERLAAEEAAAEQERLAAEQAEAERVAAEEQAAEAARLAAEGQGEE